MRLIAALLMFLLAVPVAAQVPGADPLTVTITPQYPRPYSTITITPASTLVSLSASTVTISVNGEVIQEGSGSRSATAKLGGPGSRSTVRVSVRAPDGQTYIEEVALRPVDVSLILEPSSTAHPFYEGARLVAPEGRVRIVAIADFRNASGATVPASSLVYTWKNGTRVLEDQSGIGRTVLDAVAPVRHRDARISLTVSTTDHSLIGSASVLVAPVDPFIRIYRTGPLLGTTYDIALAGSYTMAGTEDTFRAVPYFFANPPSFVWTVGGTAGETDQNLTLRITQQGRGSARIGVTARNDSVFQSAEGGFTLTFGANSTGIFGL